MKKLLGILVLSLLLNGNAFGETIMLECVLIDEGKLSRYKNNKVVKVEKPSLTSWRKEYDIRVNPELKKMIKGPDIGSYPPAKVYWTDDSIMWTNEIEATIGYRTESKYILDRVEGYISSEIKSYDVKYFNDGSKPKKTLSYIIELKHKCKVNKKLF